MPTDPPPEEQDRHPRGAPTQDGPEQQRQWHETRSGSVGDRLDPHGGGGQRQESGYDHQAADHAPMSGSARPPPLASVWPDGPARPAALLIPPCDHRSKASPTAIHTTSSNPRPAGWSTIGCSRYDNVGYSYSWSGGSASRNTPSSHRHTTTPTQHHSSAVRRYRSVDLAAVRSGCHQPTTMTSTPTAPMATASAIPRIGSTVNAKAPRTASATEARGSGNRKVCGRGRGSHPARSAAMARPTRTKTIPSAGTPR